LCGYYIVSTQYNQLKTSQIYVFYLTVNIPEIPFPIVFDQAKGYFAIEIPESYLIPQILPFLQQAGGRVKDTAFNKIDVNINHLDFINGGIAVFGDARLQHRELLARNPFTGNKHYTPWISVSGSFQVAVNVALNNEILQVGYRNHQISFDGKWYSEIADVLIDWFFKDKIVSQIKSAITDFNGLHIRQLFDKFGSPALKQKLVEYGVNSTEADVILNLVRVSANFSDTAVCISADFSSR